MVISLQCAIAITNTNTWMTKSFSVSDAALDSQQNNLCDFRVMGEAHIRRVAVRLGTEDPEIPEIPVEYITPQKPGEPSAENPSVLYNPEVEIGYAKGGLRVVVPEDMINSVLRMEREAKLLKRNSENKQAMNAYVSLMGNTGVIQ